MKNLSFVFFIFLIGFNCPIEIHAAAPNSAAATVPALTGNDHIDKIKQAVLLHLEGSAHRDIAAMNKVLHEQFRIIVNDPNKGPMVLDKATMLGMYEQGKFGGEVKPITIESIDIQGDLTATVKVKESGAKAIFNLYFSLVQQGGEWKIISELAYLEYLN